MGKRQLNIYIPEEWLEQLKKIARKIANDTQSDVTHIDLVRLAIEKEYKLKVKE